MPDFSYEQQVFKTPSAGGHPTLFAHSNQNEAPLVVGVDEAGCGPWAGPVVAGAVMFRDHTNVPACFAGLLDDSKKISETKRKKAFTLLTGLDDNALEFDHEAHHYTVIQSDTNCQWYWGIGIATVADIDRMNIRQAALLAMKRAVMSLPYEPYFALIDGIAKPDLVCPCLTIKKGDGLSYSIAAASTLAKVYRDRLMCHIAKAYPEYAWESNAGYGTKQHQEALALYGVTPHHRTTFKPIAYQLNAQKGEI